MEKTKEYQCGFQDGRIQCLLELVEENVIPAEIALDKLMKMEDIVDKGESVWKEKK